MSLEKGAERPPSSTAPAETVRLWAREYEQLRVIPSSFRLSPSRPLSLFAELIDYPRLERVFDAGCGLARNAVYVARKGPRVIAGDFSRAALRRAAKVVASADLRQRIDLVELQLDRPLPFPNACFDLCLDSYVFCHFLGDDPREGYWRELVRVTRPGGLVYTCVFSEEDEYYARLAGSRPLIVTDPANQLTKRLYGEAELKRFVQKFLTVQYFIRFDFLDEVPAGRFRRSVFVVLLRK